LIRMGKKGLSGTKRPRSEDASTPSRKKSKKSKGIVLPTEEEEKPKQIPRTLDNTREYDETTISPDDEEVFDDAKTDEFSAYFEQKKEPKVLITTTVKPTDDLVKFAEEFVSIIGPESSEYRKRKKLKVKEVLNACIERDFTDVIVISEHRGAPHTLTLVHLPKGPTAQFKITNPVMRKYIPGHGNPTDHRPELILNNFTTRLGHTIGRMFASLFPHNPEFVGRRLVTFHNQRDFIFFRQHRYIFESSERTRIQELGPRFTLRLRWLQHGLFDLKHGEYEWHIKKEIETSRRRFFL